MKHSALGKKLIKGMNEAIDHSQHKEIGAKSHIPKQIDVHHIRSKLDLTQEAFASKYGFAITTLRNWEQGIRAPTGPARILLMMLKEDPKGVERLLQKAIKHQQECSRH